MTIRRSARRRKTVQARQVQDRLVLSVPLGLTEAEEEAWARKLVPKVLARTGPGQPDNGELAERADLLRHRYLPQVPAPASIRWVHNQNTRWGSCTPAAGTIRISHRVARFPQWVQDAVIVHELTHLVVRGHGPQFWAVARQYPETDRSRTFLQGVAYGMGAAPDGEGVEPGDID